MVELIDIPRGILKTLNLYIYFGFFPDLCEQ